LEKLLHKVGRYIADGGIMKTTLLSSLEFRTVFGFSFIIILLLACLHQSNAQQKTNQNTNTNTNSNSGANTNISSTQNVNSNQTTTAGSGTTRSVTPCPSLEAFNEIKVTAVYKRGTKTDAVPAGVKEVQLGDEITLEVNNLRVLLDKAKCTPPNKNVVLFLDGRPVKEVTPYPPTDPAKNTLSFPLKRTEKSRDVWTYILGEPRFELREREVSVGLEDEYPVSSEAGKLRLQTIPLWWFVFWTILFILLFVGFIVLAKCTNLLRDEGPEPSGGERRPYSLARTQAAWWFFIVLASYLFIGMITGDFSTTITGTVLTLLGISAGTVVGSVFVDASKPPAPRPAAPAPPPAPGPPSTSPPPATAPAVRGTPSWKNEWWWQDILSDADGVTFHRFQMAAWTFVLGIIFVVQVYYALAMPEFNGTLLALLGISAGTFLGAKIPEATVPKK
jgi:hypothetical protein